MMGGKPEDLTLLRRQETRPEELLVGAPCRTLEKLISYAEL